MKEESTTQFFISMFNYSIMYMIVFLSVSITIFVAAQLINKGCTSIETRDFMAASFGFGYAMFNLNRWKKC